MIEDTELLRRYAEDGSDTAFTDLVQRRLGLVYAIALRQTEGDIQRAEDVAQSVFTDLARKAGSLALRPVLAGWLCRSAEFAARDVMRAERRRLARERKAYVMSEILSDNRTAAEWDQLRPDLDRWLGELNEIDHDALVLRYFDDRPLAEIGVKLGLTENAARMRIERALDKMRVKLARRGLNSTSAALAAALTSQACATAPAGLVATVARTAMVGATGGSGLATVLHMGMNKFGIGVIGVLVVVGTTGVIWQQQHNRTSRVKNTGWTESSRLPLELGQQRVAPRRFRDETSPIQQRAEIATDSQAAQSPVPSAPNRAQSALTGILPKDAWANVGQATPSAALQTASWAVKYGEAEVLKKVIAIRASDRPEIKRLFASLPDEVRTQYGSPDALAATLFASGPVAEAFQVLSETAPDANTVFQRVRLSVIEGNGVMDVDATYQQGLHGWQLVIPSTMLTGAIRRITGQPPPPRGEP